MTVSRKPSLRVERSLQREGFRVLAGMDEVGRGALAGPVSVGVCVVSATTGTVPPLTRAVTRHSCGWRRSASPR